MFVQEMRDVEGPDGLAGLRAGDRGQRRDGGQAELGTRREPQQPHHLRRTRGQSLVGPGEHGPDVPGQLTGVQGIEPGGAVAQFLGQGRQCQGGSRGGAGRRDGQGQGQALAPAHQFVHRAGFAGDPIAPEVAGEQFTRVAVVQDAENERVGAPHRQPAELIAAGDDGGAGPAAGQQRRDLSGVVGVVKHHQ
jgi:hypothetical protein